jgi:RluA family pseudouridine synthase
MTRRARRVEWLAPRAMTFDELAEECRRRGGWDEADFAALLAHGGVYVDGRRVAAGELPPGVEAERTVVAYAFADEPVDMRVDASAVLYDRDGLVAVNKPAYLTVQGARRGRSLEEQLRELLGCPVLTAAHRLDHGTSGVVLFARTREVAAALARQFAERSVDKRYVAWVRGVPVAERWSVRGEIVQVSHPRHARYALVAEPVPGSRSSATDFVRREAREHAALVEAQPITGRTHQIRLHLAAGGTPIAGDFLYGSPYDETPRLLLHAESITVRVPGGGLERFVARAPEDFVAPRG